MISYTQNDFTERTGIDLSADVREDGITADRQATALIESWKNDVYEIASLFPNCINSDKLNESQIEDIKQAITDYGRLCWRKGYAKDDKDLWDIAVRNTRNTLRKHGIIVNGFKGRYGIRGF